MFQTIRDIFKVPELRNKILYTLAMLALVRLGCLLPSPLVDGAQLSAWFKSAGDFLELFDIMSGSAFSQLNLFAMGIQPYINASIIMSLLCVAIPALEEIQKDGESGQKKINQITRYITIGLALVQSFGISYSMSANGLISDKLGTAWGIILSMAVFVAGSMFVMWVGETITEKGIGNGISLIIMVNILSSIPTAITNLTSGSLAWWQILIIIVVMLAMIVFVTILELAERRIPVQYAKRIQGRKTYGGSSTYIPIRVNMAGVIPIIFASSIISMPQMITAFITSEPKGFWKTVLEWLDTSHPFGAILYVVLIVVFTYFYASITFNPIEMSENLKKNGGYIPGFRPGRPTVEYLQKSSKYVTTIGAIFIAIIAILPVVLQMIFGTRMVITGSSLMIIVGVALETVKQIEGQMVTRHYKGFLSR